MTTPHSNKNTVCSGTVLKVSTVKMRIKNTKKISLEEKGSNEKVNGNVAWSDRGLGLSVKGFTG